MFLPIGDEPNPKRTPVVTYGLIAVNVAVFLFISLPLMSRPVDLTDPALGEYLRVLSGRLPQLSPRQLLGGISAYDLFTFKHGFRPADPSWSDLFASMFLHGGWLHLGGNMLFLWIFGDNVEARLGRIPYLGVYLLTGALATATFAAFELKSQTPLVGASGAISGVLGCYFLWFPANRVRLLVVLFFFIDVWRVPARLVLGLFVVVDNLLPFLMGGGGGDGVAYGAHLGGFLGGLGVAYLHSSFFRKRGWSLGRGGRRPSSYEPVGARFTRAVREGRWGDAAEDYAYMSLAERDALLERDVLSLADGLAQERPQAALAILQRFIATRPLSESLPAAHLRAGLLQLRQLHRPAAAREHFLTVLDYDPDPQVARAARDGLALIDHLLAH